MRQSHLILSNAVIMWITQGLQLVPQVILVPYLIGAIGESGYGVYVLLWSLIVSIDQLGNSLQSGVVKYSAGFLAQGRINEVNKVVSSSFVYSIFLAILSFIGISVVAILWNDPTGQITPVLIVVGIMILFMVPLTPFAAIIQSTQRYYVGAVAGTISKYMNLAAIFAWFSLVTPSVKALIIITASTLFLSRLAQVPIAYRLIPGLQNHPRLFEKRSFRLIAAFGAITVLASICLAVNSTGVRWLMDILVSTNFVAQLAIIIMPGMILSQIIGAVSITIMPATSAYEATGNQRMLQELLIRGMRYSVIMALAGFLVASLIMKNVLLLWVGPDYAHLAPYAVILFASEVFMQSSSISHHMLKGMGKLRIVMLVYLFGLVVVPIGLILAVFHLSRNPYVAVTAGLATGHLICGSLNVVFCAKILQVDLRRVFVNVYIQPLMVIVAVCPIVFGIIRMYVADGLIGRLGISMLAILLFIIGCYFFIATSAERQQVKAIVQYAKRKLAPILK